MSLSEKVYRFLLRAYPRDYRDPYAAPMEQLFRDRLRDTNTHADLAMFWVRTLADWAMSVSASHLQRVKPHGRFPWMGPPASRCIVFATYEANSSLFREITVEHLLLGVLRQEPSLIPAAALQEMRSSLERNEPAGRRIRIIKDLRLAEETIRAMAAATEIAQAAGREVAPRDLITAILREKDTLAARLLREHIPG